MRRLALHVALLACLAAPAAARAQEASPFAGKGMWVWQLARSEGGDVDALARRASAAGVQTIIFKAADGVKRWPQFSPALVGALHARGLRACAYHYLYGRKPVAEAVLSASIVATGADCLVVDVEGQYGGRYGAARKYLARFRA